MRMRLRWVSAIVLVCWATACESRVTPRWAGRRVGTSAAAGDVDGGPNGHSDFVVGVPGRGRVDLYLGGAAGPAGEPDQSLHGVADRDGGFGVRLASGDVNEDGLSDLLVAEQVAGSPGRVYLYLGAGATGYEPGPIAVFEGSDTFGSAVAICPSLYGDDPDAVVIGDPGAGVVHIYEGYDGASGASFPVAPTDILVQRPDGGAFGSVLACGRSVDPDNIGDLIVADRATGDGEGRIYLYSGSASGPVDSTWSYGGAPGEQIPSALAVLDFNGDAVLDIVMGLDDFEATTPGQGLVELFVGGGAVPPFSPTAAALGPPIGGLRYGASLAGVGSLDGDQTEELLVGAPGFDAERGGVFLFLGDANPVLDAGTSPDFTGEPTSRFGAVVLGAGDVNGDGAPDVLITAPGGDGRAYLYYGGVGGLPPTPSWTTGD